MFADSFLEVSGIQRSRRNFITLTSFALQAALVTALLLFPIFHPEALQVVHRLATPLSFGRPFVQQLTVHQNTSGNHSAVSVTLLNPTIYHLGRPSPMPSGPSQASDDPAPPCAMCIPGAEPSGDPNGPRNLFPSTAPTVMPKPAPPVVQRIRLSQMNPGSLLHSVQPIYPIIAKTARIQGPVELSAIIGKDGSIENLHVMSGQPLLIQAAIDAVKQWRYRPYVLNGDPVEVETRITVNFSLTGN